MIDAICFINYFKPTFLQKLYLYTRKIYEMHKEFIKIKNKQTVIDFAHEMCLSMQKNIKFYKNIYNLL